MERKQRIEVCGHRVQIDRSGQGHAWVDIVDIPASVREEIEAEIVDGKRESGQIVACNGQHYRWRR